MSTERHVELDASEPFWGNPAAIVWVLIIVGTPIFLMAFALLHTADASDALAIYQQSGGAEFGFWAFALDTGLILRNGVLSFFIAVGSLIVLVAVVGVWRGIALLVGGTSQSAARKRYDRMVKDDAVLTEDAWTHDLPEPAEPTDPGPYEGEPPV